jgi:hypothetical protein
VRVTNGNQTWSNGLNYLCGTTEINYFYANQAGEAEYIQQLQEQMIQSSVADPTIGLYSPTWVAQGANLIKNAARRLQRNGGCQSARVVLESAHQRLEESRRRLSTQGVPASPREVQILTCDYSAPPARWACRARTALGWLRL